MKKRKFLISLLVILNLMTSTNTIKAETISYDTNFLADFVAYNRQNSVVEKNKLTYIYAENQIAYCIDPSVNVDAPVSDNYSVTSDFENLAVEVQDRLWKIINYGYSYQGHQTQEYYMATQSMVWDTLGWTVEVYYENTNTLIDLSNEINVINQLIAKHGLLPSFNNAEIELVKDVPYILEDTNNILNEYNFINVDGIELIKENNKLIITAKKDIYEKIDLQYTRNSMNYTNAIIYSKQESQSVLFVSQETVEEKGKISLSLGKGNLIIKKIDELGQSIVGVEFMIAKDSSFEDLLGVYQTDVDGLITLNLIAQDYYVKELRTNHQFVLDGSVHQVKVDKNKDTNITIENSYRLVNLKVIKKDIDNNDFLSGAVFQLKDKNQNIIETITSLYGVAQFENLKWGQQVILCEVKAPDEYELPDVPCTELTLDLPDETIEVEVTILNKKKPIIIIPNTSDKSLEQNYFNKILKQRKKHNEKNIKFYDSNIITDNEFFCNSCRAK